MIAQADVPKAPAAYTAVVAGAEERVGRAGAVSRFAIAATVLIFIAPILYYSLFGAGFDPSRSFIMRNYARTSPGLGLNLAFIAAAIPTFCIVLFIHLAARLIAGPARPQGPVNASDFG